MKHWFSQAERIIQERSSETGIIVGKVSLWSLGQEITRDHCHITPDSTGNKSIPVNSNVVDVDISALLGLNVLDKHETLPDITMNGLVKKSFFSEHNNVPSYAMDDFYKPINRNDNHVYVRMKDPLNVLYTRSQLGRIDRNFFHSSTDKLFNLTRRANLDEEIPRTLTIVKDI